NHIWLVKLFYHFLSFKAAEDVYETLLGRPKLSTGVDTWTVSATGPLFPIHLKEDDDHLGCATSLPTRDLFEAELVSSSRARITNPNQISLLRSRGFYGYIPTEEQQLVRPLDSKQISVDTDDEDRYHEPIDERPIALAYEVELCQNDEAPELYLTDEEILFLLHTLGCLTIAIPPVPDEDTPTVIPAPRRLWYYLCSGQITTRPIEPCLARSTDSRFRLTELDLLRRYAAYVYYRAHGWIVRPGLALGGVHFLLYAQGPMHRHAAFAVLVDPATDADSQASKQVTCAINSLSGSSTFFGHLQGQSLGCYPCGHSFGR
ncbi:tRNA-intron endonuclease, partial [Fasciolopsis buskii]